MTFDDDATRLNPGGPSITLIVKQGPQIGIRFPVSSASVTLGREESCDVVIQDAEVSRRHCQISWQNGDCLLQDLNSTNGTFLNGNQITTSQSLKNGDNIGMGQTTLIFETSTSTSNSQPLFETLDTDSRPTSNATSSTTADKEGQSGRKWLLTGVGCLAAACICGVGGLVALDISGYLDLGIPGL